MSRLPAQMQVFAQEAQQTGSTLVLWTLKTPTAAQIEALQTALGEAEVEIVTGVEPLYTFVVNYFK
jgi:hypothetical protein